MNTDQVRKDNEEKVKWEITDEELAEINTGENSFYENLYWCTARGMEILRRKYKNSFEEVEGKNSYKSLVESGSAEMIPSSPGTFFLKLKCVLDRERAINLGLISETRDSNVNFDIWLFNPAESLERQPTDERVEMIRIADKIERSVRGYDTDILVAFLKDDLNSPTKIWKLYDKPKESYLMLLKLVGEIKRARLTEAEIDFLKKVIKNKLFFYLSPTYNQLGQGGKNSSLSYITHGNTDDIGWGNTDPFNFYYLVTITGNPNNSSPIKKKMAELISQENSSFVILDGHGGGSSLEEYTIGENYGAFQNVRELIKKVTEEGNHKFIIITGCNTDKLDLSELSSDLPIFFVSGLSSNVASAEGRNLLYFYDPETKEKITYKNDMLADLGLEWDTEQNKYIRVKK